MNMCALPLDWSAFFRRACLAAVLLFATPVVLLVLIAPTASWAQRCPAGQDQFLNCLPSNPAARARHEQWASGRGPKSTINPCVRRKALQYDRRGDPEVRRYVRESNLRGGGYEGSQAAIREVPEVQALQRRLFRECGVR